MTSRVMVTGALGVVGTWVLRRLRSLPGVELCAVDVREDYSLARELEGDLDLRIADVGDGEGVEELVAAFRPDTIIQLAAIMDGQADAAPLDAVRINAQGTANVLEAARRHDVGRVVYASSRAAYGAFVGRRGFPDYVPVREESSTRHPVTLYGLTKLLSEGLGRVYEDHGGPEFVALRFATIYGPGKRARHGPMAFISQLVEGAVLEGRSRLPQGADESDDFVYVLDVAEALCLVAMHGASLEHPLYNVSNGVPVNMGEVAAIVSAECGADVEVGPGLDPMGVGGAHYGVLDNRRLAGDLGFRPTFDISAGLRDYARRVTEMGLG